MGHGACSRFTLYIRVQMHSDGVVGHGEWVLDKGAFWHSSAWIIHVVLNLVGDAQQEGGMLTLCFVFGSEAASFLIVEAQLRSEQGSLTLVQTLVPMFSGLVTQCGFDGT